jgi:hypothetical protein
MQVQNRSAQDGHFATQQDQDVVIGRLMREQRELEAKRSALCAEADRIRENLKSLVTALREPSRLALDTEEVSAEFESLTQTFYRVSVDELEEVMRIPFLCRDFREIITKARLNAKSLKDAGWDK